jgi:chromosome partitioning protein
MAVRICFVGGKGGLGKSTLAISCGVEWHRRGRRVLLVDVDDEQLSAEEWHDDALELELDAPLVVSMGNEVRTQLEPASAAFEIVIVDTAGRNGRRSAHVMGQCDLAVLPCGPNRIELRRLPKTVAQVRDVQAVRPKLDAAILVTRKQPNTVIGRQARRAIEECDFPILDVELFYRITYGEAIAAGLGPTTYDPSSDAAREVGALVDELERRLELHTTTKPKRKHATR